MQTTPSTVTQVVWNLSKNTQNDIFPVVWNLVLCKAVKEWVWGWNFVVIYAKVKLLSCSVYCSIPFNTPLFSVLSVVLVYSINACFADLTLKFPLLLQYLSTQMSYFLNELNLVPKFIFCFQFYSINWQLLLIKIVKRLFWKTLENLIRFKVLLKFKIKFCQWNFCINYS